MEVLKLMQRIVKERNQTLVMVTHDNNLATYADRIFKIIDGKIVHIEENHQEVDLVALDKIYEAGGVIENPTVKSDKKEIPAMETDVAENMTEAEGGTEG